MRRRTFLLTLPATALAGCSHTKPPSVRHLSGPRRPAGGAAGQVPTTGPTASQVGRPRVTATLAENLAVPWGLAFLPGGDALVSERDSGRIVRVGKHGGVTTAGRVPGVVSTKNQGGEDGLLGLAVSPSFSHDHLVFAFYGTSDDNRIARMTYENGKLGAPHPIVTGIPKGVTHDGGRLAFGPDGMLWASTGDVGDHALPNDKHSLAGKILRMRPDGTHAPGNPFGNLVYALGFRDVQGLAFDSAKRLWAADFGTNQFDELNLVARGGNYGWPAVEGHGGSGFYDPVAVFRPSQCSPSGIAIRDDVLWMAALRGQRLYRLPIRGNGVSSTASFFHNTYGRLRTVETAPDGSLWLTTSNRDGRGTPKPGDDKVLRVSVD